MKAKYLVVLILTAGITANISAAPTPKPPPEPQDVNVVNTPNVTVTNPQTSVTVDNTETNPVPVVVQNMPTNTPQRLSVFNTTATFSGNGGRIAINDECKSINPDSNFCTYDKLKNAWNGAGVTFSQSFSGGWVDFFGSSPGGGNTGSLSCGGWRQNYPAWQGTYLTTAGSMTYTENCDLFHTAVCCM